MAIQVSFGAVRIGTQEAPAKEESSSSAPFRLAVLGDFTGRASRGVCESGAALGKRKAVVVDRDNLEEVLTRLNVELRLPDGTTLRFRELDDFLPDRLVPQVDLFERARDLRRRLSNPATFNQAADEVRSWAGSKPAAPAAPPPAAPPVSGASLLASMLGEPAPVRPPEAAPALGGVNWDAFMSEVVGKHALPKESPDKDALIAQVDAATSGQLRALLHQPDFQALEAAWRGLYFLTRRLETDASLKIALIDVSRAELEADLAAADDLGGTGLYRLLVEQTVGTTGAQPWALLAGLYTFGATPGDAQLLGKIARIVQQAGAPFIAAASPALVGCASLGATPDADDWTQPLDADTRSAWQALRALPEAAAVGLAMPRLLLRLPHGKETTPVESFDFEEVGGAGDHENYLWGNPSLACALLLGEAFTQSGWGLRPGQNDRIDNLPAHVVRDGGDAALKPCAEVILTERAAERVQAQGIMPLFSVQESDSILLPRFHSIAGTPLAGRW